MKKLLLLTLSVLIYVVASAGIPNLTVIKNNGKWNKQQGCVTYAQVYQKYEKGFLVEQRCLDPGNEKCPPVGTAGLGWGNIENAIQENLEMYNMTTGTIQYNDATVYYKNAHLVYDEPEDLVGKFVPEVKGVEYEATIKFKK